MSEKMSNKDIELLHYYQKKKRRKKIIKEIKKMGEDAKVAIRSIRRDGIDEFKAMQKNSEITEDDTVLIIGAGPTGICTLLCVMLKNPKHIIMCEKDEERIQFINKHYPDVLTVSPEECEKFVKKTSDHGGADVVLEVAGAESTFRLAWECARPNAIVTIVALYDKAQSLPLPDMYGKNLIFKTGGVDGCDCEETLKLIAEGKINTEPLITHTYPLSKIEEAYDLFENKRDGVIKVAVEC